MNEKKNGGCSTVRLLAGTLTVLLFLVGIFFSKWFLPYEHLDGFYGFDGVESVTSGSENLNGNLVLSVGKRPLRAWLTVNGKKYSEVTTQDGTYYPALLGKELFTVPCTLQLQMTLQYEMGELVTNTVAFPVK